MNTMNTTADRIRIDDTLIDSRIEEDTLIGSVTKVRRDIIDGVLYLTATVDNGIDSPFPLMFRYNKKVDIYREY